MEIDCPVSRADYLSGACFGRGAPFNNPVANSPGASKQFAPLKLNARAMASLKAPETSVKGGIPLQPVNLLSTNQASSGAQNSHSTVKGAYWTAVW